MSINIQRIQAVLPQSLLSFHLFLQVGNDPEIGRYKRVKEEEERLRADLRRDSMVNRKKERATGRNLSKGYLEGGDSDEDGVSLAQIKSKYKKGSGSKASGKTLINSYVDVGLIT